MITHHSLFYGLEIPNKKREIVDLIVTSPPYPLVPMWDELFSSDKAIEYALKAENYKFACQLMHMKLSPIWFNCIQMLKPGGIMCINVGDAVRSSKENGFAYYSNASHIINDITNFGLTQLPLIIWRKVANTPNSFLGSGMLPTSIYNTMEYEWILVFRKGNKRTFTKEEIKNRRESALFFHERNVYASGFWNIPGTCQKRDKIRTAEYPIEIPLRLIRMFSVYGDIVTDPFLGTGTTSIAAAICGRNSVGFDTNKKLQQIAYNRIDEITEIMRKAKSEGKLPHNKYKIRVKSKQETDIIVHQPTATMICENNSKLLSFDVAYEEKL